MDAFTCHIKTHRLAAGLTQEELAQAVGVRRETIMRLEAAKYNPSLKLALDIANVLGVSVYDLFIFD
ncbi:helix-turn-helix transcriptional regulator [Stomatohabitans albus]|uniref:helix-turn-helix transcriptional regulator n=1 Tax=Stomatohabitans albus TaxID=3110766 RepID=UPI00300DB94A